MTDGYSGGLDHVQDVDAVEALVAAQVPFTQGSQYQQYEDSGLLQSTYRLNLSCLWGCAPCVDTCTLLGIPRPKAPQTRCKGLKKRQNKTTNCCNGRIARRNPCKVVLPAFDPAMFSEHQ